MTTISRNYQDETDYEAMRRLAIEIVQTSGLPSYATIGDMDWWRCADSDPSASVDNVRLWLDDTGCVLAFAWPSGDQVDILVHPSSPYLHDAALAWAEFYYRLNAPEGSAEPLRAWGFTGDAARNAALEARGYRKTDSGLVYYVQALMQPLAPPTLPAGYTAGCVLTEEDIHARVAVQRAAFQSEFMTVEKQLTVMGAPTYRSELDVVVLAPDRTFAAFALVWYDEANRLGVFEPVGVSAAHQRLGLGRAVMQEGLRRLQAVGAHRAVVQTGPQNEAACRLYEAAGFIEIDRCYAWTCPMNEKT